MLKVLDKLVDIPKNCEDILNDVKALLEYSDIESAKVLFIKMEKMNKEYFSQKLPIFEGLFPGIQD